LAVSPDAGTVLRFTKMHGLGNDFVVLDGVTTPLRLTPEILRRLAHRQFGVGCDQVLLVEPPTRSDVDFNYRIFNADGGEVEQCGNGARCFVAFVHGRLTDKTTIRVLTKAGVIAPTLHADGEVTVDMGAPQFEPSMIPFVAAAEALRYPISVGERELVIGALSMGNPHAVQCVEALDNYPVSAEGALIEHHPRFPARVNAGFMHVQSRALIELRVYERGAGETLACGTGACAAVVTGIRWGLLDNTVTVRTRGGDLSVTWRPDQNEGRVSMTGGATHVFEGEFLL
jgi:diaminopimelate epimerase